MYVDVRYLHTSNFQLKEIKYISPEIVHMPMFNFRLDKKTRKNLDLLAQEHMRSRSNIIKLMINMEAEELEKNRAKSNNSKTC